jgi:hypothetical protein
MPETERVFTNLVIKSAQKRGGGVVNWVRRGCVGPTDEPYTLRQLAIVNADRVVAVARVDARGRVYWHEPYKTPYEIEIECDRCDGCGWHEGGEVLQTTCGKCDGSGIVLKLADRREGP